VLGRLHLEGADEPERLVGGRPGERDRVGPPLALDRHRDLILGDPVEIPFMVLGQMLDDVDGVEFVGGELLGKRHARPHVVAP
jgi:hypothetical protein